VHARVVTVQMKPGAMDELISMFRDSIVPAAKAQKGRKGTLLLVDRGTGKAMGIGLWETEADMKASESHVAKVASLLAAPAVTERFEVAVQD